MKKHTSRSGKSLSHHQFAHMCYEKLVEAARDLAWFTRKGVHATEIVELAHKCEHFQQLLALPEAGRNSSRFRQLRSELLAGLRRICRVGRRIWVRKPQRLNLYRFPFR